MSSIFAWPPPPLPTGANREHEQRASSSQPSPWMHAQLPIGSGNLSGSVRPIDGCAGTRHWYEALVRGHCHGLAAAARAAGSHHFAHAWVFDSRPPGSAAVQRTLNCTRLRTRLSTLAGLTSVLAALFGEFRSFLADLARVLLLDSHTSSACIVHRASCVAHRAPCTKSFCGITSGCRFVLASPHAGRSRCQKRVPRTCIWPPPESALPATGIQPSLGLLLPLFA